MRAPSNAKPRAAEPFILTQTSLILFGAIMNQIPTRPLGKTGRNVTLFGLGGEGVLRTFGLEKDAAAVINRALDQGVTYCDTAPAYAGSLDYYGGTLGERRQQVFWASKTHDRTRDGSLKLLDESLRRARKIGRAHV